MEEYAAKMNYIITVRDKEDEAMRTCYQNSTCDVL